jgi:hypothetical protein
MKEIKMNRRNKLIVIVATIVSFCVIAAIVYDLGYGTIRVLRDLRRMEANRPVLLYHTDHRALLEACREVSKRVTSGEIKINYNYTYYSYSGNLEPEKKLFPKPILDLAPFQVYIEKNGMVDVMMSPVVPYGVRVYSEGMKRDYYGDLELIPGLWYYDQDFVTHPEHKKQVGELLKERKAPDSSGISYNSNHNARSHYLGQETACIVFLFENKRLNSVINLSAEFP